MFIQRRNETLPGDAPIPPSVRVILVVDSSDMTAAAIPQFCSYLSHILDRLSHIHRTSDIKLGLVAFSTSPSSPGHSPIVSQTSFQTPSNVLSLMNGRPSDLGIGQISSGSGVPMAIVDGIIAALEMFDLETTALHSAYTFSHNIVYHLILATSQPPEKIQQSSAAARNQFDSIPTALRKRHINLSLFLTAPNPSLHHMYNQAVPDAGSLDKPWFSTDGNSVYLAGMTSSPKPDPRGSKRRHDVDAVDGSYSRSGPHGSDPTRAIKRLRPSETSGIVANPDMQSYPSSNSRPVDPVDHSLPNLNVSSPLGGPQNNTFIGGQASNSFDLGNSSSVNIFDPAVAQSIASWDTSSYPDSFFTTNGVLDFSSNYLSDAAPNSEGQRFDLQYSAPSDPSAGLYPTGFHQSGYGSSSSLSDMLNQSSGGYSSGNPGENLHSSRDSNSNTHPNAYYNEPPNAHSQHQSPRIANGGERLSSPSQVAYPTVGGVSSSPSLGSRIQLQLSSQTINQASSPSTQFNEHTNYYPFPPYPSQSLIPDTFPPNSVPLPSSAETRPYQSIVSGSSTSLAPVNGADSPNAQSGLRPSQKKNDGQSQHAISPKEALALGPISHPQIPRTVDHLDTLRDHMNNAPANESGASTSLSYNLPSALPSPLPDTPQSSGDDVGGSEVEDGDEPFDPKKSMKVLEMVLLGAERHQTRKRMDALRGKPKKNKTAPPSTIPTDTSSSSAGPSRITHAPPPPSNPHMLGTNNIPNPSQQRGAPSPVGREWSGIIHVDGQSLNGAIRSINIPVSTRAPQGPPLPPENWPERLFVHDGTMSGPMDWTAFQKLLDANNLTPVPVRLNSQTTGAGATQIEPETQGYLDLIGLLRSRNSISRILFDVPGGPQGAGIALYAAAEAGTSSYGLRAVYFERIPVPHAKLSSRSRFIATSNSASSLTGPTLYPTPAEIQRESGITSGPQNYFLPPSPPNDNPQQGLSHPPYQYPPTSTSPPAPMSRNSAVYASSPNEFLSTNVATYPNSFRAPPHTAASPNSLSDNTRFPSTNRVRSVQFGDQPAPQAQSYDEQVSHGSMRAVSTTSNDGMGPLGGGIPPRGSHGEPPVSLNDQATYGHGFPPRGVAQTSNYPLDMDPINGAVLGAPQSLHQSASYHQVTDPRQFSPGQAHA